MKEQRITIEIDPKGRITAEADGFTGDACMKDLERLLEGLAPGATTRERKPDTGKALVTPSPTQSIEKQS